MPPKKKTQFIFPIESREQCEKIICEENTKLSIIDLHLAWCGWCEAMTSNWQTLWFGQEEPESRIEFWSCATEFMPEHVLADLKHGPMDVKPRFLFFKGGEKLDEITGCDYATLVESIKKHIPNLDD